MEQWFGLQSEHLFHPFSTSHVVVLTIAVLGIFLMLLTYHKWVRHPVWHSIIRWTLVAALLASELSYQIWTQYNNIWNFKDHAPLHLCGISSIIALFALLSHNRLLVQLSFYFGVIPAFLALVTPDLPYDFQHYRFWKFFGHHTVISWACLFVALSRPDMITLQSFFKCYSFLVGYALILGFFVNPLTGANYLYLDHPPQTNTLLSLFGEGFIYYISLGLTAFLLFFLQYHLWKWIILKRKNTEQ